MKRVISLKEFSTTPTVSCMLRKDGNNVSNNVSNNAADGSGPEGETAPNTANANAAPKVAEVPKAAPKQEDMFDME